MRKRKIRLRDSAADESPDCSLASVRSISCLWPIGRVRHFSLLRSGLRRTETAPCGDNIAGHFSKSVRSGAPPVCVIANVLKKPNYTLGVSGPTLLSLDFISALKV